MTMAWHMRTTRETMHNTECVCPDDLYVLTGTNGGEMEM